MRRAFCLPVAAALLAAGSATAVLAAVNYSPNGFSTGNCTWYGDGRAIQSGWLLKFSQSTSRNANQWCSLVTNGYRTASPGAGRVMVLDTIGKVAGGHVAYIESTQAQGRWTVTHANFSYPGAAVNHYQDKIRSIRVNSNSCREARTRSASSAAP